MSTKPIPRPPEAPTYGLYLHKKSGETYRVTGLALDCTNAHGDQWLVLYERESHPGVWLPTFAREAAEFMKKFKRIPKNSKRSKDPEEAL